MSLTRTPNVGSLLLKVYRSNRSLFLNASYIILITTAFSKATNTTSRKMPDPEKVSPAQNAESQLVPPAKPLPPTKLKRLAFLRLMKAAVPSALNPAVFYFLSHLVLLVARALITIKVASLDGRLVGALISRRLRRFWRLLALWMLIGVPASVVNALLTWTRQNLSNSIRTNLNNDIMDHYLPDNMDANYYSLVHLSGNKIADPSQRISIDVMRLSYALSSLPGQVLKPTLDLLLCAKELSRSGVGNGEGTLALGLVAHFSTMIIRFFSPPFAKLAAQKANLEGLLRSAHSRIVNSSEQVAFLRGHSSELDYIDYCYYTLEQFLKGEYWKRAVHEIAQTFIVKYLWGAAGLVLCSAPIFIAKYIGEPPNENHAGEFITNRRLLMSASDSLDRLIYSRRYLLQFIGHASRVADLQELLHDLKHDSRWLPNVKHNENEITFDHVRLQTPADVTLIDDLSFSVKSGDHLLIAGPNGSGKSSLFRLLGGLWPCKHGSITIPLTQNMFYLPQRAYLCRGLLKEQIIYPHSIAAFDRQTKITEQDLRDILAVLDLGDIADQLNLVKNWDEELSMGAQQRLAMARLYYHRPKFAVLDECTSAAAPEMEQLMYSHAQSLGITVLTVAHRPDLWHFHKLLLKFDGKGNYYFGKLDAEKRFRFEQEKQALEKNLRNLPLLKERLSELQKVSNAQHEKYDRVTPARDASIKAAV